MGIAAPWFYTGAFGSLITAPRPFMCIGYYTGYAIGPRPGRDAVDYLIFRYFGRSTATRDIGKTAGGAP